MARKETITNPFFADSSPYESSAGSPTLSVHTLPSEDRVDSLASEPNAAHWLPELSDSLSSDDTLDSLSFLRSRLAQQSPQPSAEVILSRLLNEASIKPRTMAPKGNKKMKKKNANDYVREWNDYFRKGDLEDYQRLCGDVGLNDSLPSKTQCVKALKKVNINICQFLGATNKPRDVIKFQSYGALLDYTERNRMYFPRKKVPQGSLLATLLKVFN